MPVIAESWTVAPAWLTVQEAAMLLGMHEGYVQAMVNTQEVETTRSDAGRVLISKASLQAWEDAQNQSPTDAAVDYHNWRETTWSVEDAARRLPGGEVSKWLIHQLCHQGAFGPDGAFRVGRIWRIRKSALRAYKPPVYRKGRPRKGNAKARTPAPAG